MNINELNSIIKKKISQNISYQRIIIEDKTYLHKKHKSMSQFIKHNTKYKVIAQGGFQYICS